MQTKEIIRLKNAIEDILNSNKATEIQSISLKDKTTPINIHTDNWDENKIKILGLLSTDWDKEDGGGFIYDRKLYPLVPTEFLIFNSRVEHTGAKIKSDKRRFGIDFTVSKL